MRKLDQLRNNSVIAVALTCALPLAARVCVNKLAKEGPKNYLAVRYYALTDALPSALRLAKSAFKQDVKQFACQLKSKETANGDTALRKFARTDLSKASQTVDAMFTAGTPFEPELLRSKPSAIEHLNQTKWFNQDDATYGPEKFGKPEKD